MEFGFVCNLLTGKARDRSESDPGDALLTGISINRPAQTMTQGTRSDDCNTGFCVTFFTVGKWNVSVMLVLKCVFFTVSQLFNNPSVFFSLAVGASGSKQLNH